MPHDKHICGTCKFNKWEKVGESNWDFCRTNKNIRFYCSNENSKFNLVNTRYDNFCEFWESK